MNTAKQIREPRANYLALEEPALLRGFELLATADGGVAKLRELILALAVQGRLVSQNSSDEPARSSLTRIRAAKEQLIASEKTKRRATMNHTANVEPTTELPDGWEWAHLSELVTVLNGRAYAKQELLDAGTPVLRVGNLFTSKHWYYSNLQLEDDKYCDAGDLLFAWSASFGPFIWAGPKVIYHYHIWKLALHSETEFYKNYLYTFLLKKTQEMKASGHGVSMLHITKEAVEKIAVPVPPLAEQHRIVARVEDLMTLCDELEARGRLADEQHTRLTTTLFDALTASDSAQTLAHNWQRIATHFDLLLDRPQAIDALEQTILQLAVRGLLVPQDASDESGRELLTRIQRARTSRRKLVEYVDESVRSMEGSLPHLWSWASMDQISNDDERAITDGPFGANLKTEHYIDRPGYRVVRLQNIGHGNFRDEHHTYIDEARYQKLLNHQVRGGDLVVAGLIDTSIRCCIVPEQVGPAVVKADCYRLSVHPSVSAKYVALYLNSAVARRFAAVHQHGLTLTRIGLGNFRSIPIPVPPLAEQHRIVARVEQLRRLCADLRERLNKVRATQTHLAEALVTEAVQPQRSVRLG